MKTAVSFLDAPWREALLERFLRYVAIDTTSDREKKETPSTRGQFDLARLLVAELEELGLSDISLTPSCYVLARLPASPGCEAAPPVALMAHMDTASDVSGANVQARVHHNWQGNAIELCEGTTLDPAEYPELAEHLGDTLITSDGTTLLGADDKAGIAAIMTALAAFHADPALRHPALEIIFTPDEETGKGLPDFPQDQIHASSCYTLDGGGLGEIEDECFNAFKADICFTGSVIHIGHARGKLANAVAMAAAYVQLLPRSESPEATDNWYGYWCPMELSGDLESAKLEVFLRDFDRAGMARRLEALDLFARTIEAQFPGGRVEVKTHQQYMNMKEAVSRHPAVMGALLDATKALDIPVVRKPIRGGTDGSRLTELGVPTPNVFAGGHNFHSLREWASLGEMCAAVALLIELAARRSST